LVNVQINKFGLLASTYFFVWSINGNVSLYTDLSKLRSLIKELYVV